MIGALAARRHYPPDPAWAATANHDTTTRSVPTLPSLPGYLATNYTDPTYGTKVVRISGDPGTTNGVVTWGNVVQHQYFLAQAWNADESVLHIDVNQWEASAWASGSFVTAGGNTICTNAGNIYQCTTSGTSTAAPTGTGTGINNGGTAVFKFIGATSGSPTSRVFLNGSTYAPLSYSGNGGATYSMGDYRWSPNDPAKMYFVGVSGANTVFGTWTPSTNAQTVIATFTNWSSCEFGDAKGYCDRTGNRWLITGTNPSSQHAMFVYDINAATQYPSSSGIVVTTNGSMVSRAGSYMVTNNGSDVVSVYDMSGTLIQTFTNASGEGNPTHFDNGIDPSTGLEVIAGRANSASERMVRRNLGDGVMTTIGPANSYLELTSCRSTAFPHWGVSAGAGWLSSLPIYQGEIVSFKLDGSKFCRLCYHFNSQSLSDGGTAVEYYGSYPKVSISPTGTRMIFGSTWSAQNSSMSVRPCYLFVVDLR